MGVNKELLEKLAMKRQFGASTIQRELKIGYLSAQRVIADLLLKGLAIKSEHTTIFQMVVPPNDKGCQ
jgi:predicted transcriptional regulator